MVPDVLFRVRIGPAGLVVGDSELLDSIGPRLHPAQKDGDEDGMRWWRLGIDPLSTI